ncbi:haloacid dehalogenase [Methanosalsum natronophilum]|uniref:Haloacid dehalogenase n=1 Tax=Methanosalsum natronophilum TaxID=768733 RepID=A0A424Z3X4_9EURY|nr:haloacid dehalogenase [Methanosalsum natronophilum]MCS3923803.1 translin [Methanosalsum natronophilum]RQD90714.1 MAG: haloacid dehalogenase [Methanosalsum natronophilum]
MNEESLAKFQSVFDLKETVRNNAISLSREIVQKCRKAVYAIHRGEPKLAMSMINEGKELLSTIDSELEEFPDVYYGGFVEHSQQELVETIILYELIFNGSDLKKIPTPECINVSYVAYLNGLADVPGELRRHILSVIRDNNANEGEHYLKLMEDIYSILIIFDYPDVLLKGLRHKTDRIHSLIERTEGDLTNAMMQQQLENSMKRFDSTLTEKKIT